MIGITNKNINMSIKVNIKDTQGKVDFSQSGEPTLSSEQTKTGWFFIDWLVKGVNWLKTELGKKADDNQSIDYDLSAEPAETGTKSKTANVLWQNLFNHTNFLWLKLKTWVGGLFSAGSATTNNNYLPKIDDVNKKLVKSNIYDDGTNVGIGTTTLSEKLHVDGNVIANGYKVGSGTDTKLLTDGGGTKLITDFATENTKNTAGATDTSSKIYLVGSTDQTANPQTYTHDTAYVDVDGSVYSGSSKTITVSDLETNQIVTPTLNPTWTIRNYAGTVVSSPTNPSGSAISGTSIILEYGFKPSMTVKGKWVSQAGYDNPTSCSGLCGTILPASNVETASTASINLYNPTTYSSTVVPTTTSDYWTIFTPKKGITISGSSLVLPIDNISASARVQVTYQLPIYYGNVTSLTITEADVKALSTKTWKNYQAISKSVSPKINSSDSQYWIYAYPAAWGSLSTISNADGDWTAAFTTANTISITGAPGLAITYNYYITVNRGAFKNKVINFS